MALNLQERRANGSVDRKQPHLSFCASYNALSNGNHFESSKNCDLSIVSQIEGVVWVKISHFDKGHQRCRKRVHDVLGGELDSETCIQLICSITCTKLFSFCIFDTSEKRHQARLHTLLNRPKLAVFMSEKIFHSADFDKNLFKVALSHFLRLRCNCKAPNAIFIQEKSCYTHEKYPLRTGTGIGERPCWW